jgi:hypothetical protein
MYRYKKFDGATYICEVLKWFSSATPDEYQDNTNKTAALKTVLLNNFEIKQS